jgi:hypothetical protein
MSSTLKTPFTHEIEARVMPVASTMTGLELTIVFCRRAGCLGAALNHDRRAEARQPDAVATPSLPLGLPAVARPGRRPRAL